MGSPIVVNAAAVRLSAVKALTNAIRNGGTPISIKTAEAIETMQNDISKVASALTTLTVTVPATPFTYQLEYLD